MKALLVSILMAVGLVGVMLLTGEPRPAAPVDLAAELPAGWRLEDIDRAMPSYGPGGTTYVLAWKIVEDDRPLRLEQCVALKHTDEASDGRWVIASLHRHPGRGLRNLWEVSLPSVAPELDFKERMEKRQSRDFKSRPGNREVYAFLDDYHWDLGAEQGFRLIDGRVCERTWQAGVGERPTKDFPR
jgi:hypothetical protein